MSLIFVTGGRRTGTTLLAGVLCADTGANPLIGEAKIITKLMEVLLWARDPTVFNDFNRYTFADEDDLTGYFAAMIDDYVERTRILQGNPEHIVLKSPEYCLVLEDLVRAAPDARIVISVRDPRDQITSELEVYNRDERGDMLVESQQFRHIRRLTSKLNKYYAGAALAEKIAPDRVMYVRYEDLITNFEETVARLNAFTGMSHNTFDPGREWPRYAAASDLDPTQSDYTPYYGKALEAARIGRYREALDPSEVRIIETECRALMERFNYEFSAADDAEGQDLQRYHAAEAVRITRALRDPADMPSEELRHQMRLINQVMENPALTPEMLQTVKKFRRATKKAVRTSGSS